MDLLYDHGFNNFSHFSVQCHSGHTFVVTNQPLIHPMPWPIILQSVQFFTVPCRLWRHTGHTLLSLCSPRYTSRGTIHKLPVIHPVQDILHVYAQIQVSKAHTVTTATVVRAGRVQYMYRLSPLLPASATAPSLALCYASLTTSSTHITCKPSL